MEGIEEKRSWRKIALFQRILILVLISLMLISSFFAFYVVPFDENYDDFYLPPEEGDYSRDNAREISVNPMVAVASIPHIIELSNASILEFNQAYFDVVESEPSIESDAMGIAYLVVDSFQENTIVHAHLLALMFLSVFAPILYLCALIRILSKYLVVTIYKKEREVYQGNMNQFRLVLCLTPFLIFFVMVAPGLKWGVSLIVTSVLCVIGMIAHMICSYLKDYTWAQRKYRSILHVLSWLGIAVSAVFIFALFKSNLISRIVETSFIDIDLWYIMDLFNNGNFSFDEIFPFVFGLVQLCAIVHFCHFIGSNLCRLSMATIKRKHGVFLTFDSCIGKTIFLAISGFLFFMVLSTEFALEFSDAERVYFLIIIGTLLSTTLVEVLILILGHVLVAELGEGGKSAVLDGTTYASATEGYDTMIIKEKERKKELRRQRRQAKREKREKREKQGADE